MPAVIKVVCGLTLLPVSTRYMTHWKTSDIDHYSVDVSGAFYTIFVWSVFLDAICTRYYLGTIILNLKQEELFFYNLNFKALNNLIQ